MKGTEWRSVRKIRRVGEIIELMKMVQPGEKITLTKLRENLIRSRMRTSQTYLGLTRRRLKHFATFERADSFLRLAEDRIAFAKKIGIWTGDSTSLTLSSKGINLRDTLEKANMKPQLLQLLLESPYMAYKGFLDRLARLGGIFQIPERYSLRSTKEFRMYLMKNGFLTDGASFHVVKDLFYDFELLNWRAFPDRTEKIFLTRSIYAYEKIDCVKDALRRMRELVPRQAPSTSEVASALVDSYLRMGFPPSEFHDIIQLRDQACDTLLISDQEFARHLRLIATNPETTERIRVGVGPLVEKLPVGYGLKLVTLPRLLEDEPITRVMVMPG